MIGKTHRDVYCENRANDMSRKPLEKEEERSMKFTSYIIAMMAIVISSQTTAASSVDHDVPTTGDLVVLCAVTADDPSYEAARGFCLGYIDAALDYHAALTAGPNYEAIVCPDEGVAREEVVTVVLEWSESNDQHLDSEAPVHGVMRALVEKWPCS